MAAALTEAKVTSKKPGSAPDLVSGTFAIVESGTDRREASEKPG